MHRIETVVPTITWIHPAQKASSVSGLSADIWALNKTVVRAKPSDIFFVLRCLVVTNSLQ